MGPKPQLFSDPGKKREPFLGKTILVGQPPKKRKGTRIGATEQLRSSPKGKASLLLVWACEKLTVFFADPRQKT